MTHQGALWPSVMITLGPHWRKVKILPMLAARKCILILMLYIVTSCIAQLKL